MRKKLILISLILLTGWAFGQSSSDENKNIPNVIPPSPTVNSLMKFEEVPVSNYTGIPDVTIPIASLQTGLNNIPISLNLKYHVNNAASESKASETGLGWSLFAGGTISRTVLGSPDEKSVAYSLGGGSSPKLGIYLDETTSVNVYKNYFGAMVENPNQASQHSNAMRSVFDAHYKNRYDTQYDLYQYNFLSYTGRFIIKKVNGQLQVMKLDKNNLKISVNALQDFTPVFFNIIDDFGNKFVFDVLETSSTSSLTYSSGLESYTSTSSSVMNASFNSAFHLSAVKSADDIVKVLLKYDTEPVEIQSVENSFNSNLITYNDSPTYATVINQNKGLLPKISESSTSITITGTRRIKEIELPGKGNVLFEYENGREDTNYVGGLNATRLSKLKSIVIQGMDGKYDEKFNFNYVYKNNGPYKRLFLTSVQKMNKFNGNYIQDFDYQLDYYSKNRFAPALISGKEIFFKCSENIPVGCAEVELLKSVTYPTKGKSEFFYENGTFSFVPEATSGVSTAATELSDYDENPLNWDTSNHNTELQNFVSGKVFAFTVPENNTAATIYLETSEINQYSWTLRLLKKVGSNYIETGVLGTALLNAADPVPTEYRKILEAGDYYLELISNQLGTSGISFNTSYNSTFRVRNSNNLKYLFDYRNVRIKNINYYTEQNSTTPDRTVNFNYHNLLDNKKSTGGLVFPKPLYTYTAPYVAGMEYTCSSFGNNLCTALFIADITYRSDRNFLPTQKTKGSDIGYQYVTVNETGRGKTVYQYTSPIDQPNPYTISTLPPFNAVANYDYTRGNLLNKKVYDNNNILLTEDRYTYSYTGYDLTIGATVQPIPHSNVGFYLHGGKYVNYDEFYADTSSNGMRPFVGNDPFAFLTLNFQNEHIGTANLIQEKTINYYPSQRSAIITTDNEYNSRDYLTKKTITSSDNTVQETSYQYAHEKGNTKLINANIIAIPLEVMVTEKESPAATGIMASKTETQYSDTSHLFPSSVLSYNIASGNASEQVTFNQYDPQGNILQFTAKNGVPTTVIWGYNNTQPIAKIEGAIYNNIKNNPLITAIINASNADAANPAMESNLISALDTLRNDANFKDYQMATITYNPLIGVTSLTPPSGIREIYIYDHTNRLEKIVDEEGKILKEYQYHYKP